MQSLKFKQFAKTCRKLRSVAVGAKFGPDL